VVVDKELIGGFIIKGDDFNIDKSINNNIENMFKGMVGGDNV
jgi:F0F1-type ATP synthase delta subunit